MVLILKTRIMMLVVVVVLLLLMMLRLGMLLVMFLLFINSHRPVNLRTGRRGGCPETMVINQPPGSAIALPLLMLLLLLMRMLMRCLV